VRASSTVKSGDWTIQQRMAHGAHDRYRLLGGYTPKMSITG